MVGGCGRRWAAGGSLCRDWAASRGRVGAIGAAFDPRQPAPRASGRAADGTRSVDATNLRPLNTPVHRPDRPGGRRSRSGQARCRPPSSPRSRAARRLTKAGALPRCALLVFAFGGPQLLSLPRPRAVSVHAAQSERVPVVSFRRLVAPALIHRVAPRADQSLLSRRRRLHQSSSSFEITARRPPWESVTGTTLSLPSSPPKTPPRVKPQSSSAGGRIPPRYRAESEAGVQTCPASRVGLPTSPDQAYAPSVVLPYALCPGSVSGPGIEGGKP
jgi:hypothetical protein